MSKIRDIIKNHEQFENSIEKILQYANEIVSDLPYRKKISNEEKFLLLESLILRACALWEKFIEKELVLAVSLNTNRLVKEMNLKHNTKLDLELIRAILFSDIFRDFHDLEKSKSFFNKFIASNFNFCAEISTSQIKNLQFIYKIRNYLSHYSEFSRRKLFDAYKKKFGLKRFVEPGQFLYTNKGQRFQDLIANFKYCSINMKKKFKKRR